MTRQWTNKGPCADITTRALIDRLRDDAAYMASGHTPKSADDARAIGIELCELLGRVDEMLASTHETDMVKEDREWRNNRQPGHR